MHYISALMAPYRARTSVAWSLVGLSQRPWSWAALTLEAPPSLGSVSSSNDGIKQKHHGTTDLFVES